MKSRVAARKTVTATMWSIVELTMFQPSSYDVNAN
jgi:hypothetical protein